MTLQEKLALACRILAMQGHNDMIYGHVSALTETAGQYWIKGSGIGLTYPFIAGGLNEIRSEPLTRKLTERVLTDFGVRLDQVEKATPEPLLDHSGVQQMLFELGTLQRFYSHKEYGMDRERLDVVWRRVEGGSK